MLDNLPSTDTLQAGGAATGAATGVLAMMWWFLKGAHRRIDAVQDASDKNIGAVKTDIDKIRLDISEANLNIERHKTFSAGAYVTIGSLDRIHARLDEMFKILLSKDK